MAGGRRGWPGVTSALLRVRVGDRRLDHQDLQAQVVELREDALHGRAVLGAALDDGAAGGGAADEPGEAPAEPLAHLAPYGDPVSVRHRAPPGARSQWHAEP